MKSKCYNDHKQGFYVYAKPNLSDSKTVIKYIGRYLGRPVIATSRIDNYDGDTVTFHYNRHEDNKYIVETLPAIDFIKRLIRHIPEALQNDSIWWLICQTSKNRRKTLSCDLEKQTSYLPEFQPMADCHSFFFWL
ncbi:MAG: transposase [Coprococcus phoceensis]